MDEKKRHTKNQQSNAQQSDLEKTQINPLFSLHACMIPAFSLLLTCFSPLVIVIVWFGLD